MRWVMKIFPSFSDLSCIRGCLLIVVALSVVVVTGCRTSQQQAAIVLDEKGQPLGDLAAWPPRQEHPRPYAEGTNAEQILHDRFVRASKASLGTPADRTEIKEAILADINGTGAAVSKIHWFSPELVMAQVGWYPGLLGPVDYYYVVQKKDGKWRVLIYYMLRAQQISS